MIVKLDRKGRSVARIKEFIDESGVKWITPAHAAEIWNQRAAAEYNVPDARYTRWSVMQRKEKLTTKLTPGGILYLESQIQSVPLRPHPKPRPDASVKRKEEARQRRGATSQIS